MISMRELKVCNIPYVIGCVFLFILLMFGYPVVICYFPYFKSIPVQVVQTISISVLFLFLLKKGNLNYKKEVLYFIFAQAFVWCIYLLIHGDKAYFSQMGVCAYVFIAYLFVENFPTLKRFVCCYVYFITFLSVCGVVAFLFVFLFNITPLFEYVNLDTRPGYFFYITCTNSYVGSVIRYSGIFDEPGAMAFWGVFALILNRLVVENRKIEYILIVCILFTFSLAYFVQLVVYVLFFYANKLKYVAVIVSLFVASYFVLTYLQNDDKYSVIYQKTLGRLEFVDGKMLGDNRSELVQKTKPIFLDNMYFGVGASKMDRLNSLDFIGANMYTPLARDGVFGAFFQYSFLFWILFKVKRKREYYPYFIIILLGLFQRPSDLKLFTVFMYVIMFSSFILNYRLGK